MVCHCRVKHGLWESIMVSHSPNSIPNHLISPTRVPVRLPREIILPPFLLSLAHRAQLPRQQEPGNYKTPAIRPDGEGDGQLRTENLACESIDLASGRNCFPFCLISLIVSLLLRLFGYWENPRSMHITRSSWGHTPEHFSGNLAPAPGSICRYSKKPPKSEHLSVLLTPISLDNKQRHPGLSQ